MTHMLTKMFNFHCCKEHSPLALVDSSLLTAPLMQREALHERSLKSTSNDCASAKEGVNQGTMHGTEMVSQLPAALDIHQGVWMYPGDKVRSRTDF